VLSWQVEEVAAQKARRIEDLTRTELSPDGGGAGSGLAPGGTVGMEGIPHLPRK
jgi:hypothetical protein